MKFRRLTAALLALIMIISLSSCFDAKGSGESLGGSDVSAKKGDDVIEVGGLQVHFLELGNKYTGDCTYIRAGEVDILIDAGSKTSSIKTIDKYLSKYVTDDIIEYVIVTHAHEDHFAGFATKEGQDSLFDLYEFKTIIDFSQIEKDRAEKTMYKNYIRERDFEIKRGATHYTAAQCVEMGGTFDLGGGMTLTILDSYFYYNQTKGENNHSVCTLISDGTNNCLFTGDLEEEGEQKLVEMNELPQVKLFKAGHHGSKTSSTDALLSVIKPEIVCVCCCCGSAQYTDTSENQFPTQKFIDRVAPYTDAVYVTTICQDFKEGQFSSMNGNIAVIFFEGKVSVRCSENTDKLKDTKWFKENRNMPQAWQK